MKESKLLRCWRGRKRGKSKSYAHIQWYSHTEKKKKARIKARAVQYKNAAADNSCVFSINF